MKRIIPIAIGVLVLACGSTADGDTTTAEKATGQSIFNMNCSLCHGRDGKLGLNGAKDLTVSTLTKPEMVAIVRSGKGAMMPYKNVLTPKEIDAVVDHVRTLGKAK
ncbi:MAG: cytochrome c [Flavobacteriales bacterium]|nr:cytochrome c [Flavobacteriales bacterium]